MIGGHLFAIVTARGHHPSSIRRVVSYFIKTVLTDDDRKLMLKNLRTFAHDFDEKLNDKQLLMNYLNECEYIGVSHPDFIKKYNTPSSNSPEEGKKLAIKKFVERVSEYYGKLALKYPDVSISLGFSDDDLKTIGSVKELFESELITEHPHIKFVLYDTSDKNKTGGNKIIITKK
mgnify:FL=1